MKYKNKRMDKEKQSSFFGSILASVLLVLYIFIAFI